MQVKFPKKNKSKGFRIQGDRPALYKSRGSLPTAKAERKEYDTNAESGISSNSFQNQLILR